MRDPRIHCVLKNTGKTGGITALSNQEKGLYELPLLITSQQSIYTSTVTALAGTAMKSG